jgi:hypothetical protein
MTESMRAFSKGVENKPHVFYSKLEFFQCFYLAGQYRIFGGILCCLEEENGRRERNRVRGKSPNVSEKDAQDAHIHPSQKSLENGGKTNADKSSTYIHPLVPISSSLELRSYYYYYNASWVC